MGGIVSTGKSNEDLIDNLVQVDYIKTSTAEIAFRAVDRAEYFLPENRGSAYQDAAWKCGHLHISAPCIYSEVIEGLCLEPGLSFLNLGSGTGYLSTVVGIILGPKGINHGIEYHEDVVQYAYTKLEEFKKYSGAIDEFDFCEPVFARANCLCLSESRLYDRVYCGAACPPEYEQYLKNLIKVGGILVVPISDNLIQYRRTSKTHWESKSLLPVSFASLLTSNEANQDLVRLLVVQPQSLQALSRQVIRSILRKNIAKELPSVVRRPSVKEPSFREALENRRMIKRYIVPILDDSSDEDLPRGWWELSRNNNLLGHLFEALKHRERGARSDHDSTTSRNDAAQPEAGSSNQIVEERRPSCSQSGERECSQSCSTEEADSRIAIDINSERNGVEMDEEYSENPHTTSASMVANDGSVCSNLSFEDRRRESNLNASWADSSESEATSSNTSRSPFSRKKVDSDIDENEILEVSDSEKTERRHGRSADSHSRSPLSASDAEQSRSAKRSSHQGGSRSVKWRRVASEPNLSTDSESDDEAVTCSMVERRMYQSRYSTPMKKKIQELPLPQILKNYVNYYRDF